MNVSDAREAWYLARRTPCHECGGPRPWPCPRGTRHCSDECRRSSYLRRTRAKDEAARRRLDAYKLEHGCSACGYRRCAAALEFHHRDADLKLYTISSRPKWSASFYDELEKCTLLCSNCHREHHHSLLTFDEAKSRLVDTAYCTPS